jgi:hypothetical protein
LSGAVAVPFEHVKLLDMIVVVAGSGAACYHAYEQG